MNRRLTMAMDMIKPACILADIGTDHAHLCISLMRENRLVKAYACDIAPGPLRAAKTAIARAKMEDRIFPILSDGFAQVPADADCAVIAGMGFRTAVHILEEAPDRIARLRQLIIQVNDDPVCMRRWLSDHALVITDERYVAEKGKDYILLACIRSSSGPGYTDAQCVLGPILRRKNEVAYRAYCARKKEHIEHILQMRTGEREDTGRLKREAEILTEFLK